MAATSGKATPIIPYRVVSTQGAQAAMRRFSEKATQTFLIGTPVQIDVAGASGYLIANPTINSAATAVIAGFSAEAGHNLASSGVGVPLNQGAPQNQPSAVIIPGGAWPSDGTCGVHLADPINEFIGTFGDSATAANATIAITDRAKVYGLTKDAGNNYWYIDHNITTIAGGACVEIIDLVDAAATLNGRYLFRILSASQQMKF